MYKVLKRKQLNIPDASGLFFFLQIIFALIFVYLNIVLK